MLPAIATKKADKGNRKTFRMKLITSIFKKTSPQVLTNCQDWRNKIISF